MIYTDYKIIDSVGRIVIPKSIRNKAGIGLNETVKIDIEDNKIVISKAELTCVFCGATEELETFKDKNICKSCISQINKA